MWSKALPIALAASLAFSGGAYVKGRWDGRAAEERRQEAARAATQAELDRAKDALDQSEAQRLHDEQNLARIQRQLAEEARQDPNRGDRAIAPNSRMRLNRLFGAAGE